jgi:branched-subunit amino acid aminotransferase/4-amino-4-deoxychorismate lyase
MTQRIDPLGLLSTTAATATQETAATKETARMTNTVLGACPICGIDMPVVEVGRVQAYVCAEHCVCLPTKD